MAIRKNSVTALASHHAAIRNTRPLVCLTVGEIRMSNIISFDGKVAYDDDSLVMSNGGTDVFINILAKSILLR